MAGARFDFEGADGGEVSGDGCAVSVEGFILFGGEDEDLAGEAVTISVEPRAKWFWRWFWRWSWRQFWSQRSRGPVESGELSIRSFCGHLFGSA